MILKKLRRGKAQPVHFRDEIRRSFISYALIPSSIFTVFIISISLFLWNTNVTGAAQQENKDISSILSTILLEYIVFTENPFPVLAADMVQDKNALALAYSSLKEFTARREISSDFVVIDPEYAVIMQGSPDLTFKIPEYQDRLSWGMLGRLQEHPERTLVEISSDYTAGDLDQILVGRTLTDGNDGIGGYLVFFITPKDVMKRLWSIATPFVITDHYGKVFTSTSQYYVDQFGRISASIFQEGAHGINKSDTVVFTSSVLDRVLDVYTILDVSQLKIAMLTIIGTTVFFLLLLTAGIIITASKISLRQSRSIDLLVSAFQDVESGILDNRISIESNIEFCTIADAYNKMLDDIKHLIEENKRDEKEKYQLELKQLEMQFKPHFIYNTLENIKFMIKLDPIAAQQTIVNLSQVLRYSIDNTFSQMSLEEDLKYIENYLDILKVRFSRQLALNVDMSDSARSALVPKLLVQPIIENSVKYGFNQQECLNIDISAKTIKGRTIITVTDNGTGMEKKELAVIRKLLRSSCNETAHIGLFNVQRRITLLYGINYGLKIQSKDGFGTTVQITLPFRTKKHDTDTNC